MSLKISTVVAAPLRHPESLGRTKSQAAAWDPVAFMNPLIYDRAFAGQARRFFPPFDDAICVVTASDGTFGVGMTSQAGPVVALINDFFGPMICGESPMATERLWNMMARSANSAYGAGGVASFAISAVDLALWDLKGKLLERPVYELIGGPARETTRCYATGNDLDDLQDRGFTAFKLASGAGAGDGTAGVERIRRQVAQARSRLGPDADLMLDCWPNLDSTYAIRLAEAVRPYGLTWFEDYAPPDDWLGMAAIRKAVPSMVLAEGERWYTVRQFFQAARKRVVDVLQPDVQWVGGLTAVLKVAAIADAAGLEVALHAGCNDSYGQHLCHALPSNRWAEMFVGCAAGESLMNAWRSTPGMTIPTDGWLVPSDEPGFGIDLTAEQLNEAADQLTTDDD